MAFPQGLRFENRIARDHRRVYFVCQRGHRILRRTFPTMSAATAFRANHDATVHARGARPVEPSRPTNVHQILRDYLAHFEALVERGARSETTLRDYQTCGRVILRTFPDIPYDAITGSVLSSYVSARLASSQGSRIAKELKAVQRAVRWTWGRAAVTWDIPSDELAWAPHRPRRLHIDEIRAFLEHLPPIPRAVCIVKVRVPIRNTELARAKVCDLDLEAATLAVEIRKRKTWTRVVFPLVDDALEAARLLAGDRGPNEPLVLWRGRPINLNTNRTFECSFRRASAAAGIDPPITSIGSLRHHLITWSARSLGTGATQRAVGHMHEATTARYLLEDKDGEDLSIYRATLKAVADLTPLVAPPSTLAN